MEIKARSNFSYEAYKALFNASAKAVKIVYGVLAIIIGIYIVLYSLSLIFNENQDKRIIPILIFYIIIECAIIALRIYLPKIKYKMNNVSMQTSGTFIFKDSSVETVINSDTVSSQGELQYSELFKVCETDKFIFLFLNKMQAYIVDKATIENGTEDELRAVLQKSLGNKYKRS